MIEWALVKRLKRPLAAAALCGAVAISVQGCVEMAVGTAVIGTLAATDRRTFGAQTEDKAILLKGEARVNRLVGDAGHVNVSSFNRRVLLTGEVRDEQMKAAVEREIADIQNVQSIVNELAIMPPSSLTSRSNDTLTTGLVKASFVDAKDIYVNAFKVVTERGVVYLMGRITQREGQLAAEIASTTRGVQRVVKVFDYISDDEMRELTRTADSTPRQ